MGGRSWRLMEVHQIDFDSIFSTENLWVGKFATFYEQKIGKQRENSEPKICMEYPHVSFLFDTE